MFGKTSAGFHGCAWRCLPQVQGDTLCKQPQGSQGITAQTAAPGTQHCPVPEVCTGANQHRCVMLQPHCAHCTLHIYIWLKLLPICFQEKERFQGKKVNAVEVLPKFSWLPAQPIGYLVCLELLWSVLSV